ncbi:MAG: hypothetical protein UR85_C0003G0089 [Candidatus Nomurabacteria bacterium GW2011_GWF2_35_66]|nr:MAG: hypothetical protein UR55_C0005G0088 [Candidatus Nomurabacteria bacterium GW2011_GWF1_34_20]KKP63416.1 MAG: hypothetical protein UR57_C0005G0088 [Candidatus Nomurabacteria bacterium GW2011_GWE2_34_25]KKP83654.1 MAG: hypothetical protein UR85_C0003G0089 [Candidatus Nomurabacteria bacterium GW2011_GWF2_35_66]
MTGENTKDKKVRALREPFYLSVYNFLYLNRFEIKSKCIPVRKITI